MIFDSTPLKPGNMTSSRHFRETGHALEVRHSMGVQCTECNLKWDQQDTFGTPLEPIVRAMYKHRYPETYNLIYRDKSLQTDIFKKFDDFKKAFSAALDKMVERIGGQLGVGKNVRNPGDSEYLLAFDELVLPVAQAFKPDVILVSCGLDAAKGDPLGQFELSPNGYAHMTRRLQAIPSAQGRVVVVLEGGYNLDAIAASSAAIFKTLRGDDVPDIAVPQPLETAVELIAHTRAIHEAAGLLVPPWSDINGDGDGASQGKAKGSSSEAKAIRNRGAAAALNKEAGRNQNPTMHRLPAAAGRHKISNKRAEMQAGRKSARNGRPTSGKSRQRKVQARQAR